MNFFTRSTNKNGRDLKQSEKDLEEQFLLERYKYILQQIHAVNENLYRFLALYQTLAIALTGGGLALFVGYRKWGISASTAHAGIVGLMWLVTVVAAFSVLLIVIGIFNWLNYRREECELTDTAIRPGFRKPPQFGNWLRWYETYVIIFIVGSVAFLWAYAIGFILPAMK